MDKTYYDILEVSRYATDEVINRAHKVLVKRYHPDVQKDEESRKKAAKEMVKVNEAYEVLSNKDKKAKYDKELELKEQREKQASNYSNSTRGTRNNVSKNITPQNVVYSNNSAAKNQTAEEIERQRRLIEKQGDAIRENMRQNYYNQLRRMGYKVKNPMSFKKFLKIMGVILVFVVIGLILFNVPYFANMMSDLEFSNPFLAIFIRLLRSIFLIRKV